jgi:hydrogenase/urease accessory protein HupE
VLLFLEGGRLRRVVAVAAAFALWPVAAHAHLVTTGLGPVYDGVSHLFLTFDDLLPVLAMGALGGLNGPAAGRTVLFVLPAAWLVGGLGGFTSGAGELPEGLSSLSLLLLGGLTAADRRLSPRVVGYAAFALGIVHGWANGAGLVAVGSEATGLAGVAAAIFVVAALVSGLVVSLRPPWTRIAVRVAGSWIAAVGLLFLGWILSGRG